MDGFGETDELVAARLARQTIFDQPSPPLFLAVMDEGVLRRRVGDAKVMRVQFEHLLTPAERPRITLQVVPADLGAHALSVRLL